MWIVPTEPDTITPIAPVGHEPRGFRHQEETHMAIILVLNPTVEREPAECTPGREPGWYVKNGPVILAHCRTAEEAHMVQVAMLRLKANVERETEPVDWLRRLVVAWLPAVAK
jgi:hypothetical protein